MNRKEEMTEDQIKFMVDRFLMWKLPEDFSPDGGISFKKTFNDHLPQLTKNEPVGTNLLDATQATAMVRYMVEGLAALRASAAPEEGQWHRDLTDREPDHGQYAKGGNANALPSDSGKAAPVADRLRKSCGATNGCSCADLNYQWYGPGCEAIMTSVMRTMLKDAALAPATEGGGRDGRYDELRRCAERYLAAVAGLGEESPYNKLTYFEAPILSMPSEKLRADAHDRWIELNNAGVILRAALSPSPSVGTPEMTSAERKSP